MYIGTASELRIVAKSKKAILMKECKDKGIAVPKDATISVLEELLSSRIPGPGFIVRAIKQPFRFEKGHPVRNLKIHETVWIPNCHASEKIIATQIVAVLKRCVESKVPNDVRKIAL